MNNNKKMQDLENKKMEKLEKMIIDNEMLDYYSTEEYAIEIEIENRELLNDVINDILKF